MTRPQTIQIYLPQGNPKGIQRSVITTRTVVVFDVPLAETHTFIKMDEASQVGLYFLITKNETGEGSRCYVGESEDVATRLGQHLIQRDAWDRALVAVDLTRQWTKTHVRYMEYEAIRAVRQGRYESHNNNSGFNSYTPDPLRAECDELLETIDVLTTTLGSPVLRATATQARTEASNELVLRDTEGRYDARGTYSNDGLTVFSGSKCRVMSEAADGLTLVPANHRDRIEVTRAQLIEEGVLTFDGTELAFVKDHIFDAPSGAASVVVGHPMNGWDAWRTLSDGTLGESIGRTPSTRGTSPTTNGETL